MNELRRSQEKLVLMMRLEILSALVIDSRISFDKRYTLLECYQYLIQQGDVIAPILYSATEYFLQTFIRPQLDISCLKKLSLEYPSVLKELSNWEFELGQHKPIQPKDNKPYIKDGTFTFISTGGIGFSFGSNTHLFRYLIPQLLLNYNSRLIVYSYADDLSSFPGLPSHIEKYYPSIETRDLNTYRFSRQDLVDCYLSGGNNTMLKHMLSLLSKNYGLQITPDHQSSYCDKLPITSYPVDSDLSITKLASNSILSTLGFTKSTRLSCHPILYKLLNNRPIALIATRDHVWTGPSQPWRDSRIESYIPTIKYLIASGYSVVRLNLVGEPSVYANPHFYDLSQIDCCDAFLQTEIIARSAFIVGANTGLTGYAQIIASLPTLAVDHPDLFPHSPWGRLLMLPKSLCIANKSKFDLVDPQELAFSLFSFNKKWSPSNLQSFGIECQSLTPHQILAGTKELMHCIKYNQWRTKHHTSELRLFELMRCNVLLSDQSYNQIRGIIYSVN